MDLDSPVFFFPLYLFRVEDRQLQNTAGFMRRETTFFMQLRTAELFKFSSNPTNLVLGKEEGGPTTFNMLGLASPPIPNVEKEQ